MANMSLEKIKMPEQAPDVRRGDLGELLSAISKQQHQHNR